MQFTTLARALLAAGSLVGVAYAQTNTSIPPTYVDGFANESIAIFPIDYSLARSIVPKNYTIMRKAYESLIPNWPKDKYPVRSSSGPSPMVLVSAF